MPLGRTRLKPTTVSIERPYWLVLKVYPVDGPLVCKAAKHRRRQTAAQHEAAYTNLLRTSVENTVGEGITGHTHPSRARSDDGDAVVLESLVGDFPGQPGSNHCGAGCRVVRYLRKPSGRDVNSLCRRKPGISSVTTALHLRHQGVK